jgi:hypothetical protein
MALLTGMTEDGREVPVQVDGSGRLVAEGLQGSPGINGKDAEELWTRSGSQVSTKNAGDSVSLGGDLKVGGSAVAPNVQLQADGAVAIQASGLVYDAINRRLGLGTAQPKAVLDIRGDVKASMFMCAKTSTPDLMGYSIDFSHDQCTGGIDYTVTSPFSNLDFYAAGSFKNKGGWCGRIRFFTGDTDELAQERMSIDNRGVVNIATAPVYAGNDEAVADGLKDGDIYRQPDGTLMVAF